jgi:6-pyruvoyltetrahydropterin/6-carboxytetrahydropterin synthase
VLELSLQSATLDQHGYLVDIVAIEAALDAVVDYFRDKTLNDKPEFSGLNPSIEHFSRILCEQLLARVAPPGNGTIQVKLWENATCWAAYQRSFP